MRDVKTMRTQLGILFVTAVLVLTTGCAAVAATGGTAPGTGAQAPAEPADAQRVTVTVGNSMLFTPASVVVTAGRPVELVLRNGGGTAHDFALTEGTSSPVKIEAQGGQTVRGTFTIDTPGTYEFICTVPGHAAAGMRGTLTAQ
jgi:uncharacterized cupredoxin-like copper-binding protein